MQHNELLNIINVKYNNLSKQQNIKDSFHVYVNFNNPVISTFIRS